MKIVQINSVYESGSTGKICSEISKLLTEKGIENYTILTTTNCNARCFYCYESNLPHINMEETTAKRLVEYMIENKESNTLRRHWFGGEPLVGINFAPQKGQIELLVRG